MGKFWKQIMQVLLMQSDLKAARIGLILHFCMVYFWYNWVEYTKRGVKIYSSERPNTLSSRRTKYFVLWILPLHVKKLFSAINKTLIYFHCDLISFPMSYKDLWKRSLISSWLDGCRMVTGLAKRRNNLLVEIAKTDNWFD